MENGEDTTIDKLFSLSLLCIPLSSDFLLSLFTFLFSLPSTAFENIVQIKSTQNVYSKNYHELCAFWSSVGECETNRIFMMENCVAACRLCLLASVNLMA